jgi:23S rRNA (guanosine2251-2'-O)-methyltransferase
MKSTYLYGKHTVRELLVQAPERIEALYLAPSVDTEFRPLATAARVRVEPLPHNQFMRDLEGAVHQGVVARVSLEGLVHEYRAFMDSLEITPSTSLVLLNEITDPHNVGAIIRSAAAFGCAGVLVPTHNTATLTGTVAKASAGMIFAVPLVAISNENQAILDLKKRGLWSYGLAGEGARDLGKEIFDAPAVFVVGSEGEGLREKTREHCDFLLRIPMHPRCESLNASVSAAVALSAWSGQHKEALR